MADGFFDYSFLETGSDANIGKKLTDIIIGLNSFEFSSFEEFEKLVEESDLSDLDYINMTEIYLRVRHLSGN